jgi:hypothetical protein
MGMPRKPAVETRPDGRVYYADRRNEHWRVYDLFYGPPHARAHQRRVFAPGDERATYRYFIAKDGERRVYKFRPGDGHVLTVELLTAQFDAAEYGTRRRFDASKHYSPGRQRQETDGTR